MRPFDFKIRKNWAFWIVLVSIFFSYQINSFAVLRVITVQDRFFSPSTLNAAVGDSIKWQWVNGDHTTTSSTIPAGATAWDHDINSGNPSFVYVITVPGTYNYVCTTHLSSGMVGSITVTVSGISQQQNSIPSVFGLKQNYPNPFNPSTQIDFSIPQSSLVTLKVYDMLGREAASLLNNSIPAGVYSYNWDASQFNSGMYFYKLEALPLNGGEKFTETKTMMLVK